MRPLKYCKKRRFALERLGRRTTMASSEQASTDYDWQQFAAELISGDADERTVLWIYSPAGNVGATYWADLMTKLYGAILIKVENPDKELV